VFAVVKTGGKQYKVRVGETLDVEKLAVDAGAQVRLDQVLLAASDENVAYGRPMIDGAVVTARVVRQYKGPKLIIFRYKSKSRYRRRTGHRQQLTQLMVQTIDIPGLGTDTMAVRPRPVVETATALEPVVAPQVAPPSSTGSAAPSDDVLPTVAPTAQLDVADTAAATPAYEALGDTTLPTTTLPSQTAPAETPADLRDTGSV
jgi:large subunit ribosomal protein L21